MMRFLIGILLGIGAGFAVARLLSLRLERQHRRYLGEGALEQPLAHAN